MNPACQKTFSFFGDSKKFKRRSCLKPLDLVVKFCSFSSLRNLPKIDSSFFFNIQDSLRFVQAQFFKLYNRRLTSHFKKPHSADESTSFSIKNKNKIIFPKSGDDLSLSLKEFTWSHPLIWKNKMDVKQPSIYGMFYCFYAKTHNTYLPRL